MGIMCNVRVGAEAGQEPTYSANLSNVVSPLRLVSLRRYMPGRSRPTPLVALCEKECRGQGSSAPLVLKR